jgi:hypothetical protein
MSLEKKNEFFLKKREKNFFSNFKILKFNLFFILYIIFIKNFLNK